MTINIAIANPKGGVGKTTLSELLVAGLIRRGHTAARVDLDPQNPTKRPTELTGNEDYAIVDYPARPNDHEMDLLGGADYCVVPLVPSMQDLPVTNEFMRKLDARGVPYGLVLNNFNRSGKGWRDLYYVLSTTANAAILGTISHSSAMQAAASAAGNIWLKAPRSPAIPFIEAFIDNTLAAVNDTRR